MAKPVEQLDRKTIFHEMKGRPFPEKIGLLFNWLQQTFTWSSDQAQQPDSPPDKPLDKPRAKKE